MKSDEVTKQELQTYFDGKKLPVPADERTIGGIGTDLLIEESLKKIVMTSMKITAVKFDLNKIRQSEGYYNQGLSFLYEDGPNKYACVARVKYTRIEGKIAFAGYEVNQVTKQ